jgi:hypothetical protein
MLGDDVYRMYDVLVLVSVCDSIYTLRVYRCRYRVRRLRRSETVLFTQVYIYICDFVPTSNFVKI